MHPAFRITLLALIASLLASCHQVPVTGRRGLNLVSDAELKKMSAAAFEDIKRQYPVSRDRQRIEQLNRIGERLARVVFWDMPGAEWEFVVFDVPHQINAFAMAGGKIGVFSGLYRITENDDQLAAVIAHEIAHVTAKHVHERLSQEMLINTGGLAAGAVMLGTGAAPITTSAILDVYSLSAGVSVLGFDRSKEKEADHIGLIYMARAGFNPEEAIRVIERLEEESAGRPVPPAWLSTHPSNPERILNLTNAMPRALEIYERATQAPPEAVTVR